MGWYYNIRIVETENATIRLPEKLGLRCDRCFEEKRRLTNGICWQCQFYNSPSFFAGLWNRLKRRWKYNLTTASIGDHPFDD